jgi:hypothetical protein
MRNTLRGLAALALPLLVLLAAACVPQKTVPSALALAEETPFVGNDACKPCHAAEFTSHSHTRHMQTMRDATRTALGELAPTPGKILGGASLAEDAGRFLVDQTPLQLVLGSGKTGITFLTLGSDTGTEIRQSYFPHEKRWLVTPGQEKGIPGDVGRIMLDEEARRCLACHAVTLPTTRLSPEPRFYGVGCESCHGPGKDHLAAVQNGAKSPRLAIQSLKDADGETLNAVCGECHRTLEQVSSMEESMQKSTQRFQPYGLALSRCFQESKGKLTCVTCHNPHQDAGTDPKPYEKVCLSCHSVPKKACPVNPKTLCIDCHMPDKTVFEKGSIATKMADHFIKIPRKGTTAPP